MPVSPPLEAPIRPVCRRFPASQEVWDATNLPLACVVTPLAGARHAQSTSTKPASLSNIPKCLQCGAPHVSKDTHFRSLPSGSNDHLLCYFCGKLSPVDWIEQQFKRQSHEEFVHPDEDSQSIPHDSHQPQSPTLFQLPLRVSGSHSQSQLSTPVYSLPAVSCPPLWIILLDGTCTSSVYWQTMSRVLLEAIHDIPSHVHVSLLIASNMPKDRNQAVAVPDDEDDDPDGDAIHVLSIFSLTSPIPHLLHYTNQQGTDRVDILRAIVHSFTDGMHRSHLQTALRSLVDYSNPWDAFATTDSMFQMHESPTLQGAEDGVPLTWCLELVLDALQTFGQVAGHRPDSPPPLAAAPSVPLPYAGAKLTCLLSQRPQGVCRTPPTDPLWSAATMGQSEDAVVCSIGKGGFGGCIVDPKITAQTVGETAQLAPQNGRSDSNHSFGADLSPSQLAERYEYIASDILQYVDELGRQCAQAAMGVDLLFVLEPSIEDTEMGSDMDLALPLYGHLSSRSGAPGPLLFDAYEESSIDRLLRELKGRVPWRDGMVFGAELRLRLPWGFGVDSVAVEPSTSDHGPQIAPIWVDGGLMGPACMVEDATQLWRMGTADEFTSFVVDICLENPTIPRESSVDALGIIEIHPAIQTCFAYTTIGTDENGLPVVRRQMRIQSRPVPFAEEAEVVYNSVDSDALAVVLFQKLAIASLQDGLSECVRIAEDWLVSLLVSVYKSAEDYQAFSVVDSDEVDFLVHERLLDQDGELSPDDVLLAQGHNILRRFVLITYQLLQSETFRHCRSTFHPSPDLRYAALCQMSSMTPHALNRCIAPLLQAWLSDPDGHEPIVDQVELRRKSVRMVIEEFSKYDDVIFFVDCPSTMGLLDARLISGEATSSLSNSSLVISKGLEEAREKASASYRVMPDVFLDPNETLELSQGRAWALLSNLLNRDLTSPSGHANYTKWKKDIAGRVLEELESQ